MSAVTIFSGRERRRRWAPPEKARIVEESLAPGVTVAEVARRHGVNANQIHRWRREAMLASRSRVRFLPIAMAPERQRPGDGAIEIELNAGVRLRVDAAVDEAALGRVLRALGR